MKNSTTYSHVFTLPHSLATVFDLFADPRRLDRLTPGWFRLRPLALPPTLERGATIDYRLRWRGLPLRWTSLVTDWDRPRYFAYEQARGPYRFFRHEHAFEETEDGILVRDRVEFRGPAGRFVDRLVTLPDLARIFRFRESQALELLSGLSQSAVHPDADGTRTRPYEPEKAAGYGGHRLHRRQVGPASAGRGLPRSMPGS